jgi:hypothetical protein
MCGSQQISEAALQPYCKAEAGARPWRAPVALVQRVEATGQVHAPAPRRVHDDLPSRVLHTAHAPLQQLHKRLTYALLCFLHATGQEETHIIRPTPLCLSAQAGTPTLLLTYGLVIVDRR